MIRRRALSALRAFLATEAASGYALIAAAAAALIVANSPLAPAYFDTLHRVVAGRSLQHWVDDGLMPLFFLVVGLELKREVHGGQLATNARRILPGAAALAGMIVPAMLYLAITHGDGGAARGWAVPSATDIAFALAMLSLLGRRVASSLRVFLTAVAIVDDMGAIIIIAVAFTDAVDAVALAAAAAGLTVLVVLNRRRVQALAPYLLIGAGVWYATLLSGVHPTLAGVAVALTVPMNPARGGQQAQTSPLNRLERALHPLVAFGVVPLFGFANAGLSFAGLTPAAFATPITLGVLVALFVGKQAGVFGAVWGLCRAGVAELPPGVGWRQLYGVAVLCGIGFTMSLFIATLAFGGSAAGGDSAKLGIIVGSLASALAGCALLATGRRHHI